MSATFCDFRPCRNCGNNAGGVCAYDHAAEFPNGCEADANLRLKANEVVNDLSCRLFEPIED